MKRRDFLRGLAVAVAAVSIGSSPAVAAPEPWADCSSFEKTMREDLCQQIMLSQDRYMLKGMAEAVKSMKGLTA